MPVVTADELDHLVTSRHSACEAQGAHGGFRTGIDHAHHLHGRQSCADFLCKTHLVLTGRAVAGAAQCSLLHGAGHFRMRMPQQHRPPRADEIDHAPPVCRQQMRPLSGSNEQGITMDVAAGPHGAVDPSGDNPAGAGKQFLGTG